MKYKKYIHHILALILLTLLIAACDEDGVKKHKAEALTSFDGKWQFDDASFSADNNGLLSISFSHPRDNSEVELIISFRNIEPKEGTYNLVYYSHGGPAIGKPTSYFDVVVGDDTLAETYYTDTTSVLENTITITRISNDKLEGEFQVSYFLGDYPFGKAAPWIPDNFTITEGEFNARER